MVVDFESMDDSTYCHISTPLGQTCPLPQPHTIHVCCHSVKKWRWTTVSHERHCIYMYCNYAPSLSPLQSSTLSHVYTVQYLWRLTFLCSGCDTRLLMNNILEVLQRRGGSKAVYHILAIFGLNFENLQPKNLKEKAAAASR